MEATTDLLLGNDHRCLGMEVRIHARKSKAERPATRQRKASLKGWQANPNDNFGETVDSKITEVMHSYGFLAQSLEERCLQREDILMNTACQTLLATAPDDNTELQEMKLKVRELIRQRRRAQNQRDNVSEKEWRSLFRRNWLPSLQLRSESKSKRF